MTEIDARSPEFVAWFATGEFSREYKKYGHQEAALVAWQASRQQALSEAAAECFSIGLIESCTEETGSIAEACEKAIRSLTTTGDKA